MANSGLLGPFPLEPEAIAEQIREDAVPRSAAVFALGTISKRRFFIQRVLHADGNPAAKLAEFVGRYGFFKFRLYGSTRIAYAKECRLYHDFQPKDNEAHPAPPKHTRFKCPEATCPEAD